MKEKKLRETLDEIGNSQGCVVFSTYLDDGESAITKIMGTDEQVAKMVASILFETRDIFALTKKFMEKMRPEEDKGRRSLH